MSIPLSNLLWALAASIFTVWPPKLSMICETDHIGNRNRHRYFHLQLFFLIMQVLYFVGSRSK